MRRGQITLNFNKQFRKLIKDNFDIQTEEEIKALILNFLETGDSTNLSLKDQLIIERLETLKIMRPLQKRKLELQNQLLHRKLNFINYFEKPISDSGSQILTNSYSGYEKPTSDSYSVDIQNEKNFFIEKYDLGYTGKCRVCKRFETELCNTGFEAENKIELHLAEHQKGLYKT